MPRSLRAHLLLVTITLIWGSTFVLIKQALADVSPLLLNALRMSVAAILLAAYYRKHLVRLTRPALLAGMNVGVFLFLGYAFQTTGLRLTTPSKSAFLTGVSTVLVPLLLLTVWRTRVHPWRAVGIALALAGLFLITVPAGSEGLAGFANINRGDLLTIACALAFAFHIVFLGRAMQRFAFEPIAVLQIAVAALLMSVASPILERPHFRLSGTVVTTIAVTGVLGTAVAFTVQAWAQQFTPATHTALIFTLEPVFAWLTSFLYLKERLGFRAGAGALMILAGVLVSELLGQVSDGDSESAQATRAASSGDNVDPALRV
jgi:drug/metabolite transporter (DMT)-like permease